MTTYLTTGTIILGYKESTCPCVHSGYIGGRGDNKYRCKFLIWKSKKALWKKLTIFHYHQMYLRAKHDLNSYEAIHNFHITHLAWPFLYFAVEVLICLITTYCPKLYSVAQDSPREHVMCAIHAPFYLSKIKIPEFQSISDSKVLR